MQFGDSPLPYVVRGEWRRNWNVPLSEDTECLPLLRQHRVAMHTAGPSCRHIQAILSCCEDLRVRTCNFQTPS
jgi:hypothetical protein